MNAPDNLRYAESHEWVEAAQDIARLGISDHAQAELSDVVFVELPQAGRVVKAGEAVAVVESVKAASDIYSPVSGEIVEVNSALESDPAAINNDPYGEGWILKIVPADPAEFEALLDSAAYQAKTG